MKWWLISVIISIFVIVICSILFIWNPFGLEQIIRREENLCEHILKPCRIDFYCFIEPYGENPKCQYAFKQNKINEYFVINFTNPHNNFEFEVYCKKSMEKAIEISCSIEKSSLPVIGGAITSKIFICDKVYLIWRHNGKVEFIGPITLSNNNCL